MTRATRWTLRRAACACGVWAGVIGCQTAIGAQAAAPTPVRIGRLTIGGYVQADYRMTIDEDPDDERDSFLIRRARLVVSGDMAPKIGFLVQGDFSDTPIARDIYVNLSFLSAANIRVGQFVAPFGLERLTPSTRLELIDRSLVGDLLTPSRDMGVMVFSAKPFWGWLSYGAAIVDGTGQNTLDNNDAKDLVGRLTAAVPPIKGLTVGFNVNGGAQPDGDRLRVGGDVTYERPRFRLSAERITQSVDGATERDVTGLVLIGVWKRPAAAPTDYYAGYELAARFVDVDDSTGQLTMRGLQFGGNYYITPQVRVMSNLLVPFGDDQPVNKVRWWSRLQVWF